MAENAARLSRPFRTASIGSTVARRCRRVPLLITRREANLLLCASPGVARAATRPQRDTALAGALSDEVERLRETHGLPSISVAVSHEGALRWTHASGLADRERRVAAHSDTLYALASVTKPITAVGIMRLVERGGLELDAPVNEYLGAAKIRSPMGRADQVTIRRLLDHTSGLPRLYSLVYADTGDRRRPMDEMIARFGRTMIEPGRVLLYSNLGYGVLERVIERVSGLAYPVFAQREVFDPIGLRRSFIATGPEPRVDVAQRYMESSARVPPYDSEHRGAAGACMAAPDLARFGQFLLDARAGRSKLFAAASAEAMLVDHAGFQDPDDYYGLGLDIAHRGGQMTFGHSGSMPGASAELLVVPDAGLVIALAMNQAHGPARRAIVDLLLARFADVRPVPVVPQPLTGRWRGTIDLLESGSLPLTLDLGATPPFAILDGTRVAVIAIAEGRGGYFNLELSDGRLPARDAMRSSHRVQFKLIPQGERLSGYALSEGQMQPDRDGTDFPYWAMLTRE